jgi:hypothetical protein
MSEPIDRREGVRRGAITALALSLGIPATALAGARDAASRFQMKFWVGDRLLETMEVGRDATRYIDGKPTAVQIKWYDLAADEKRPLSTLGLTESRQIKIDGIDGESTDRTG